MGVLYSCRYNKAELVYPKKTEPCDTVSISYRTDIIAIVSTHCYSCHSGTAIDGDGITLDSYADLSGAALYTDLLQMIQHDPGFIEMPKDNPKLSECNIAKIRTWIREGAPDN